MTRPLLALALLPALLLTACSAPAVTPTADPEPAPLEVAAIDGNWVVTRTVVSNTTGDVTEIGTVDERYIVVSVPECTETACTGTVLSSRDTTVFDLGLDAPEVTEGTYTWDGESFVYTFDPQYVDCSRSGEVIAEDLYALDLVYDLQPADGDDLQVLTFTGTHTNTVTDTGPMVGDCQSHNGVLQSDLVAERA